MIYNHVNEIFDDIDKTRNQLNEKVSALDADAQNFRLDETSWSATQIIEHLAIVESGLVPLVHKLLKKAETDGVPSDGNLVPPISMVENAAKVADKKLEAPERIRPEGKATLAESLAKLEESHRAIHNLLPRITAVDARNTAFPHPFFGNLNLYEWLAFIGLHETRHLRQIENVLNEIKIRG
jgi:uncharacterized damage-inducible protein DinB